MLQNLTLIVNSPLEQFEVNSLISVIAPIFGYINITFKQFRFIFYINFIYNIKFTYNK